jgi:hypothetical protein
MLLFGILAMALVVMLAAPETSAARWLRALLVERTVAWLAKLKPERLIVQGGLLGFAALLLFLVRGTDLGVLIAQMMPEVISWLVAFDVITILEVSLAIWLVATNARVRAAFRQARLAAWRWALRRVASIRAWSRAKVRDRAPRRRVRKAQKPASNDDDYADETFAFA